MIDSCVFLSLASRAFALSVVWGMACTTAVANPVNISYLEGQIPVAPDAVAAYGPNLFGDKVNLFNGSLVFEHTDLNLPGNNALPVVLVRKHTPGRDWTVRGQFGDWDMETPRIGGSFSSTRGWVSDSGNGGRCSGGLLPPTVSSNAGSITPILPPTLQRAPVNEQPNGLAESIVSTSSGSNLIGFIASDYWNGTYLHVPGQGSQELLTRVSSYGNRPNDGVASYPFVTHENWQISCLPSIQNGSGEGFVAISPQGVKYRFDWLASRWQTQVKKSGASIGRMDMYLMATEVSDRFGNRVTYQYDSANPLLLSRIESTDGRIVTVTNLNGRAIAASDGTRTYSYTYDAAGNLSAVTQPDGSRWGFNLTPMVPDPGYNASVGEGANCDYPGDFSPEALTGTITHPTGAVGRFTTAFNVLGRSGVQRVCIFRPNTKVNPIGAVWPRFYLTNSLTSKQISGPGMQTMLWTYSISAPGSWDTCTTCVDTRTVTVNEPNGSQTRHIFGSRWRVNEGQLLRVDEGWNGSTALRTTAYRYRSPAGQSYVEQFGTSPLRNNDWLSSRHRPLDQRITQVQGASFTWEVGDAINPAAGFDSRVRPVLVRKFSSLGNARSEAYAYHDNDARWVLGQLASVRELTTGLVPESHGFNADALVNSSSSFGKQNFSFSYNTDGTLSTVSDAAGRTTQLFNFRRGKPQQALYPDGQSESQVINNLGNPDSQTNAARTTTSYLYDAMGRVSLVIYPTGDPVSYHSTSVSFVQSPVPAYGLPAGHWQQSISTGNARKVRYFDGLWRERLALQFDAANPGGTTRFVEKRHDAAGRPVFESYPTRTLPSVDATSGGIATGYDHLNRVVSQSTSSNSGWLTTSTTYPSNAFQRIVTSPRGHASAFAFQAFDTASQDVISQAWLPEGVTVSFVRDVFGKATRITRAGGTSSASRSYVYDVHQRLCKTVEPETGATVQAYDLAGNVAWRASGQGFTNTAPGACDQASVGGGSQISFGYDSRKRLTSTSFGDGRPGISRSYTADGLLQQLVSSSFTWTYSYNNRRQLTREALSVPGQTPGAGWNFDWGIDDHGNVSSLSDPWGAMNYAPNALGQPTQVSGYASGVQYHPNGMVAGYTLANGITHSVAQNVRGLPAQWQDAGVMNDSYSYDANGNVTGIQDLLQGVNTRSMGYDGLDRLTAANGPWGSGQLGYDALDNLTYSQIGARTLTHQIDPASNRLTGLSGSQSVSMGYDANGNLSSRGGQGYSFDIANRMRAAWGKAQYDYDGHGRRSWVVFADGSTQLNAYSGPGAAGQLRFSAHSVKGNTRYVYLGDKLIAETSSQTGTSYSHTDALGSPVARSNSAGAVTERTRYEPYGATVAGSTNPTGIGFTGHVNDADTGLVYMQQRYYDPIAGRFLSVDPVVTDEKTGGHFNRYVYANNNPYAFVDPDGRAPEAPSFLTLTTFASLQQGTTLQGATDAGALTRTFTLPAIAVAASPSAAGLAAAPGPVVTAGVGAAAAATGSAIAKNGPAIAVAIAAAKTVVKGPVPPSVPTQGVSATLKTLKEIRAASQVPAAQKAAPPPPPPPPPKIVNGN